MRTAIQLSLHAGTISPYQATHHPSRPTTVAYEVHGEPAVCKAANQHWQVLRACGRWRGANASAMPVALSDIRWRTSSRRGTHTSTSATLAAAEHLIIQLYPCCKVVCVSVTYRPDHLKTEIADPMLSCYYKSVSRQRQEHLLCCLAAIPLIRLHATSKHWLAWRSLCRAPERHRHGRSSASTHAGRRYSPRTTSVPAQVMPPSKPRPQRTLTSNARTQALVCCVCSPIARQQKAGPATACCRAPRHKLCRTVPQAETQRGEAAALQQRRARFGGQQRRSALAQAQRPGQRTVF